MWICVYFSKANMDCVAIHKFPFIPPQDWGSSIGCEGK